MTAFLTYLFRLTPIIIVMLWLLSFSLPEELVNQHHFYKAPKTTSSLVALNSYFGFVVGILLYTLMFLLISGSLVFLYYGGFIAGYATFVFGYNGAAELLGLSLSPNVEFKITGLALAISIMSFLKFFVAFLEVEKSNPRLNQIIFFFMPYSAFFAPYTIDLSHPIMILLMIGLNIIMLFLAQVAYREYKRGKGYLSILAVSLVAMIIAALIHINFTLFGKAGFLGISISEYENYYRTLLMIVISVVEITLFSLALSFYYREQQNQQRHAKWLSEARKQFFSSVSHDLRQPLNAIALFNQSSSNTDDLHQKQIYTDKIGLVIQSMEEIFDNVLSTARLEAGVEEVKFQSFPLQTVLDMLRLEFEVPARLKGIQLTIATAGGIILTTDKVLFTRVLRNLLSNAIKYMSKSNSGFIQISGHRTESGFELSIEDNGPGISKQEVNLAFKAFSRLDRAGYGLDSNKPEGSGLGLYIVKQSLDLLNIPMEVKSTVGQGSRFTLTCPISPSPQSNIIQESVEKVPLPEAYVSASSKDQTAKPNNHQSYNLLSGLRICVLEDDPASLEALLDILKGWDCECLPAYDLTELKLKLYESGFQPDVLITDLELGGRENGLFAIEYFKSIHNERFPVAITSAMSEVSIFPQGNNQNIPVITKPISTGVLKSFLLYSQSI